MTDQFKGPASIRQLAQQACDLSRRIFKILHADDKEQDNKVSEQDLLNLDVGAAALAALAARLRHARLGDTTYIGADSN